LFFPTPTGSIHMTKQRKHAHEISTFGPSPPLPFVKLDGQKGQSFTTSQLHLIGQGGARWTWNSAQMPQCLCRYLKAPSAHCHRTALGAFQSRKPLAALADLSFLWSEVLFIYVLRPVLARDLPFWTSGITLMISRMS
jgi:hypothetical protein